MKAHLTSLLSIAFLFLLSVSLPSYASNKPNSSGLCIGDCMVIESYEDKDDFEDLTGFSLGYSGYILTNYHVVKNAKHIKVKFLNGDVSEAKIIIKDESNDIAFIKPESSPKLPGANVSLGDSSEVKLGDKVFTIGFPMSNVLGQQPRYSEGVINSLAGMGDDPKAFQISIPIQSGNSGGPLFNQKGEVVGIVSSSLDSANTFQVFGNAPQNVNFAIKSTFVKNLLPMIPDALIAPTDIVVVPKGSDNLSSFIERVQNNIVLIESEY